MFLLGTALLAVGLILRRDQLEVTGSWFNL